MIVKFVSNAGNIARADNTAQQYEHIFTSLTLLLSCVNSYFFLN